MSDLVNLRLLLQRYQASLRSPSTGKMAVADRAALYYLPVAAGAIACALIAIGVPVANGLSQLLAATGLLVGAMLTTFVFLANLRLKIDEGELNYRRRLQGLVASTVVASLYTALVALGVTFLLAAIATIGPLRDPSLRPIVGGVVAAALAHLAVSLISVIRSMFGVYYSVFEKDFAPVLTTVSGPTQEELERARRSS